MELQEHHNDEEVQKSQMELEVQNLREKLEFITKELAFYKLLLNSDLIAKSASNFEDARFLLSRRENLEKNHQQFLQLSLQLQDNLTGFLECDDVQCENHYLKEYLDFKVQIEQYLRTYREFKEAGFRYLGSGIKRIQK